MRRVLQTLRWIGLVGSTLIFAATLVLWVRNLGHSERVTFSQFKRNPGWNAGRLAKQGTEYWRSVEAANGWLLLNFRSHAPLPEGKPWIAYTRCVVSGSDVKESLKAWFSDAPRFIKSTEHKWHIAHVGFCYGSDAEVPELGGAHDEWLYVAIPFWVLALVFGPWPIFVLNRRLRHGKRYAAGLCPSCGYDLRATPERCPECGTVVKEKPVKSP